ncbi:PD-(D/E)XK motif protein [Shewanella livingstonensis]|nr:PD-(D/E)XK motif protein [Shewanella livingstonensis]
MAQNIEDEIKAAWSALAEVNQSSGWQAVFVTASSGCKIMAGRHYPENEEALIIGFKLESSPNSKQLPKGKGFHVESISDASLDSNYKWIGLIRTSSGSLEIFLGMIRDIMNILIKKSELSQSNIFSLFIGRIRAWQEFMSRSQKTLSSEAEIGLYGELVFLKYLLLNGVEPLSALKAWFGPSGGLQDFIFEYGAIEVKSTLAEKGFPAKILSLEQLDDSIINPLYFGAVRLNIQTGGVSLPKLVEIISEILFSQPSLQEELLSRLLIAGYHESHQESYTRCFVVKEIRIVLVDSNFPRLIPANVPTGVKFAKYEIDIDDLVCVDVPLNIVLNKLDVSQIWN